MKQDEVLLADFGGAVFRDQLDKLPAGYDNLDSATQVLHGET